MSPERAIHVGVNPSEVQVSAVLDKYGDAWVAWVPDPDRERRVLTQFAASDPFGAARWINKLRRLAADR